MPYFHGFTNLDDFYAVTQAAGRLHKVRVPAFFLGALDDPTIDPGTYAFKEFESHDMVLGAYT